MRLLGWERRERGVGVGNAEVGKGNKDGGMGKEGESGKRKAVVRCWKLMRNLYRGMLT